MKIVHTSDIRLGASFVGLKLAGDKLRAGLKASLSRIVDYTLSEKADMLLIAGNLFDSHEVSKNLQDYAATQLRRLGSIPVVILPGQKDTPTDIAFWRTWEGMRPPTNVYVILDKKKAYLKFKDLNCSIFGLFSSNDGDLNLPAGFTNLLQESKYNIAVASGSLAGMSSANRSGNLLSNFDYIALGGQPSFMDLSCPGFRAAFSGGPEQRDYNENQAGNLVEVEITDAKNLKVEKVPFGRFVWKELELQAKEIANNDDLVRKINEHAGENVILRVKLSGLALFEAGLGPEFVHKQISGGFLYLDIIDEMIVFPENVSEVKVSEKTILGQYLRLMAQKLNSADEGQKRHLEKSIKIGYSLLAGRELW
jgi:DNA repair protein SbcD/Mre11